MKPQSLKELQEAVSILGYTATDLSNAKEDILNAIDRIKAAIFMETPMPKGSFDLWDFVSNDEIRPAMCGIFYDSGFKVASDMHVLVAVKSDYDETMEHHIIGKDGLDIIHPYPKWQCILPTKDEDSQVLTIDTDAVYDAVRRQKAERKMRGKHSAYEAIIRVGDAFFKAEWMVKACRFMDHYGVKEIRTWGPRRAARVDAPDGSVLIIMPVIAGHADLIREDGSVSTYCEVYWSEVWEDARYDFIRVAA